MNTFPCAQCGAQLAWDAAKRSLSCPYCGHQQPLQALERPSEVREIPIEEGFRLAQRGLGVPVTTLHCKECGATVHVGEGERTAACAFCGSKQVLQIETDANAIRPESLVAFQVDRASAQGRFTQWLGKLWFRPNDLHRLSKVQEIGGVYVPFWTFDAHVDSSWTAESGYYYYETEEYTAEENGETVTRSRQVQRVRWEPAWGSRHDFHDDTLVCASKGLPHELVDRFSTFNTKQLVPYLPHYLAGWRAEAYAIDLHAAHSEGHDKMAAEQVRRCAKDVPGDTQRFLNVQNVFAQETFKHVLLPIWIAAYRYNNKVYRFLVNGQTGEVVGKAPYSVWKIALLVVLAVALIGLLAMIYSASRDGSDSPSRVRRRSYSSVTAPSPTTMAVHAIPQLSIREATPSLPALPVVPVVIRSSVPA
ncbi:MAG: hypothetical protein NVS3B20_20740 [Polyangiales bacterium]